MFDRATDRNFGPLNQEFIYLYNFEDEVAGKHIYKQPSCVNLVMEKRKKGHDYNIPSEYGNG